MDEVNDSKPQRQQNRTSTRILSVLSLFARDKASYGVTELSQQLGVTKNMVYRALTTLVEQGYLVREGTQYELGFGVLELPNRHFPEPDFRSLASDSLKQLHALTRETVLLSIQIGDSQVVIDGIEGHGQIVVKAKLGVSMPLHLSAASRAILSALPDAEIEDYIQRNSPLETLTDKSIGDAESLWQEVKRIRKRGYAEGMEDYRAGSNSLSFPIMAADGRPHGALTLGGPSSRFTKTLMKQQLPAIVEIVEDLRKWAQLYQSA